MSNDGDYETARTHLAAADGHADAHREAMWEVVSRSWSEQAAQARRRRVAASWGGAGLALAAALVAGILIGRTSTGPTPNVEAPSAATPRGGRLPTPYRVAVGEHFRAAETVLALFAADAGGDDDLERTARELAVTTRLLIDSRAGEDQEVRRMLLDLELLLVQIARLVDARDAAERQVVQEGLDDSAVLPRLRQMIPRDAEVRI